MYKNISKFVHAYNNTCVNMYTYTNKHIALHINTFITYSKNLQKITCYLGQIWPRKFHTSLEMRYRKLACFFCKTLKHAILLNTCLKLIPIAPASDVCLICKQRGLQCQIIRISVACAIKILRV
jgi:hypothetical protein